MVSCVSKISFLGFSMGGIIIRSGLRYLTKYRKYFCSYISFGSPHLGMCYSNSFLVSMGMKFFVSVKKYESIKEILFKDQPKLKDNFFYKLSKNDVVYIN